jgi:hypothetical protein
VDTIILDKDRFKIELDKLKNYDFAAILVEGNIDDILAHRYISQVAPQAVIATINSIMIVYGIPIIFASNRATAKMVCEDLLIRYWEMNINKINPLPGGLTDQAIDKIMDDYLQLLNPAFDKEKIKLYYRKQLTELALNQRQSDNNAKIIRKPRKPKEYNPMPAELVLPVVENKDDKENK